MGRSMYDAWLYFWKYSDRQREFFNNPIGHYFLICIARRDRIREKPFIKKKRSVSLAINVLNTIH